MESNPGIEPMRKLASMGYQFMVVGETIRAKYKGSGIPDASQVGPLIALVKDHKMLVMDYLAGRQETPPERILLCSECPWHWENPWTHYPELPAWCDWHFDHLAAEDPACIGYRRGEIPKKADHIKPPRR